MFYTAALFLVSNISVWQLTHFWERPFGALLTPHIFAHFVFMIKGRSKMERGRRGLYIYFEGKSKSKAGEEGKGERGGRQPFWQKFLFCIDYIELDIHSSFRSLSGIKLS